VLAANADEVAEYRAGDEKVRGKKRGYFFGEVMKATDRKANAKLLNRLLDERLNA
jgi:aspartyl-tRNA(Asn)/glutamyl-tRNA(Gln) amidotransferase subunit B